MGQRRRSSTPARSPGATAPPASPARSPPPTASTAPPPTTTSADTDGSRRSPTATTSSPARAGTTDAIVNAGAVTWGDGTTGITGPVTTTNSLHGTTTDDRVGRYAHGAHQRQLRRRQPGLGQRGDRRRRCGDLGRRHHRHHRPRHHHQQPPRHHRRRPVGIDLTGPLADLPVGPTALTNGNYVVTSPYWDNGSIVNAGAVTWADGTTGITGPVTTTNSLHGTDDHDRVGRVCFFADAPGASTATAVSPRSRTVATPSPLRSGHRRSRPVSKARTSRVPSPTALRRAE